MTSPDRTSPEAPRIPYQAGPRTFFRAPFVEKMEDISPEARIAFLGIPYDEGTTNRPGTRFGPRIVRDASMRYGYRPEFVRFDVEAERKCVLSREMLVDVGDVRVVPTETLLTFDNITATVAMLVERKLFPVCIGGDHAITFPIMRAIAPQGPVNIVQLDTHLDFNDDANGARYAHGNPMRRCSELENVGTISQVGIRGFVNYERYKEAVAHGNIIQTVRKFRELGPEKAAQALPAGNCYITLDIDAYDPSIAPGTGTPEPGGFYFHEVKTFLSTLASRPDVRVIGFDIVEVDPLYDSTETTPQLAARTASDLLETIFQNR